MSFLGQIYKFDSEENFEAFVDHLDLSPDGKERFKMARSEQTLVSNPNGSYTLSIIGHGFRKNTTFYSGVELEEKYGSRKTTKTTYVLAGNVLTLNTQQKTDNSIITYKREYTDSVMKVTYTVSGWNGAAVRYYKA